MHRIIIPVDFSETSLKAARYAAQMLAGKKDVTAMLYNNYDSPEDLDISVQYLENLGKEFSETGVQAIEMEYEMGGDLVDNICRLAHTFRATLVIMGINGKSAVEHVLFGSNTLKLVDKNLYPVLIIPPEAVYKGIRHVAFASDFINVEATTPSVLINAVLEMFNPVLHIVNVDSEHYVSLTEEIRQEKEKFIQMFSKFKTEFYFITMNDFFEALDLFVKDYNVDLVITIPRHQANSAGFFSNTHTRRLAYQSYLPVLSAHE